MTGAEQPRGGSSADGRDLGMYLALGMTAGVAVGTMLGLVFDNVGLGLAFGPALGLSAGLVYSQVHDAGSGEAGGDPDDAS